PDSPDSFQPIIMVTGHTEKARITEARDAGINELMAKPVSAKSLYRRLVSVIEHPRQFVRTKTYFGPDRRRKVQPFEGPNRRTNAAGADAT
ncbi:MAG: response regulator, partial [Alphaproteobacteria bacterium]|nr:response regulator [Alphaproteobacteria bacterium]